MRSSEWQEHDCDSDLTYTGETVLGRVYLWIVTDSPAVRFLVTQMHLEI